LGGIVFAYKDRQNFLVYMANRSAQRYELPPTVHSLGEVQFPVQRLLAYDLHASAAFRGFEIPSGLLNPEDRIKKRAQRLPRSMQANFDCGLGDTEPLRGFIRVELLDVAQEQHRAV
jgi:hypothetical protein